MRTFIAATLCCLTPVLANAGSSAPGKVHSLIFTKNGTVIFWTSGARSGLPGCAVDDRWEVYVGQHPREGTATLLSGLQMAYSLGKDVVVQGTGLCVAQGEGVEYFYIADAPSAQASAPDYLLRK